MKIKIDRLFKSYGDKNIFTDFSAEFDFENILIIKGRSGLGKTTLLRLIAGLEKPDGGSILMPPGKISFMFQEDRLISFVSVLKNLTAVCDKDTALKYLSLMQLENEAESSPAELSGGMKRRVALARALAYESSLVILDEPFKGLDENLKGEIIDIIKAQSLERPFIVVTHDSEDSQLLGGEIFDLDKYC